MTLNPQQPTPEQLALARRIATDTWELTGENRQAVLNGEWDNIRQVRCALAAIIETTEQAAKLVEQAHKNPGWRTKMVQERIAAALRNNEHLKDQP